MRFSPVLLSCLALFAGCKPTTTVAERLEVDPSTLELKFGEEQQVIVRAFVAARQTNLDGLTWTSSDPTLVSVTPGEFGAADVRGIGSGTATLTAQVREAVATVTVTVAPRPIVLERLELTPPAPQLAKGLRLQLTATGVYNDGSTIDLTATVAWASADTARATVNAGGLVSARAVGDAEVRAIKDGIIGRLTLSVTAASIVGLDVRPAQVSLARGSIQQFSATARLSDASTQDVSSQVEWSSATATVATLSATGRLQAVDVGTTVITATLGAITGTSNVTVTDAVIRSLLITPAALSLPLGSSGQLTVSGVFSDGTQLDVSAQATWRSGTVAVATIGTDGRVTGVGMGLSVVTATVGDIAASASITCIAAQLERIELEPQALSLAVGQTRTFTATGHYTDATTRDLTTTLTWNSSNPAVASVSNTAASVGLVRALTEGTTTLSATNGSLSGTSTLTVTAAALTSIRVSPATATLAQGLTLQLTAQGTFSDASQRDVTAEVTWTPNPTAIAAVSNATGSQGLLAGVSPGPSTITATSGAISGSMLVEVGPPLLQRIEVTAPSSALAKGRTQQLTATGFYSDGPTQDLTATVTWGPGTGAIVSVASTGVMTAFGLGSAAATATVGAITGSLTLTVTAAELTSLAVTPALPSIALGLTQAMAVTGTFSDSSTAPITTGIAWSSATEAVATISSAGLVSSVTEGSAIITAVVGAVSGSTTVTIAAPMLASIAVTPATPAIDKAQTLQLIATGRYTDNSTAIITNLVTWETSAAGVVSVSTTGEVTGVSVGPATIRAVLATITGSTVVTVNRPPLLSLAVTPATSTVDTCGSVAFSALATYVDLSTEVVTSLVAWSSSDGSIASIAADGLASGVAIGTVTISALFAGTTRTAQLTVGSPTLQSITLTGRAKIANGSAVQLRAIGTLSCGSTTDVTAQADWSSDTVGTAKVSNVVGAKGIVEGLAPGAATLSASVGLVTASLPVQVIAINAPYAGRCSPGLVISQIYGGGGNASAPWRNDFVELHNPTASAVNLNGKSLQYASATGTTWNNNVPLSSVVLPAGGYYLLQLGTGGAIGAVLPGFDQSATGINMSASAGKLALVEGTAALTGGCPTANVIDFVGYGSTASCFEGTFAPAGSNTTWLTRGFSGCRDGNQNGSDFTSGSTTTPRFLGSTMVPGSAPLLCDCVVNGTTATEQLNSCVLQSPANLSSVAGEVSPSIGALVTQPAVTDTAGFNAALQVQTGFGPSNSSPASANGWRWWPAPGSNPGPVSDAYEGVFLAPASGSYGFTTRATLDGVNWTVCDLNGAGSGAGLALETSQLGVLSVP